jgi:hypothetical protein
MPIKSPWPAGQKFVAGGFTEFIAATWMLATLASIWFVGTILSGAALLVLAALECGFGVRGYYYNEGTHTGRSAFAIDFTRYQRFVPFYNLARDTSIKNVAHGIVMDAYGDVPSDDPSAANYVEVRHIRGMTQVGGWSPGTGSWTEAPVIYYEPYESRHMHLAGPRRIPVSVGMSVGIGARLGPMDDTGNSAISHLHFLMRDVNRDRLSLRPSPMDGQTLGDGDDGKCLSSTNS